MKSFEFPLQTALKVRKRNQDLAHRKFAAAQGQYHAAENQLRHYQRLLGLAEQTAQAAGRDDVDVMALLDYDAYRRRMAQLIDEQAERCRQLREAVSQARRGLMEACRERQTLQRLRENHYQEYLRELAGTETRTLDEAGTMAYNSRYNGLAAVSIAGAPLLELKAPDPLEAS